MFLFFIVIAVLLVIVFGVLKIKRFKLGNLTLVTGGVKTGKTEYSVALAVKQYRKQIAKWRKAVRLAKLRHEPVPEKPLLYSNVPIGRVGDCYVPLTYELLTRKHRFRYGSVIYVNEVTFVAGSMDFKDDNVNESLLELFKLIAHETKGGYCILDTQSPADMHFAAKRSLSSYVRIYKRLTFPIFSVLYVREVVADSEGKAERDSAMDIQDSPAESGFRLYKVFLLNRWWKYYDQYAYSIMTDDKPVEDNFIRIRSQKVSVLLRIKNYIKGGNRHG